MISARALDVVRCPDCGSALAREGAGIHCPSCARSFAIDEGFLDLRPKAAFAEQTKYLDHALHADARHETIAPPLLGSKIRNDMLQRFLAPGPQDQIVDLGCGSGRAMAWTASSGAAMVGIDISPFFASEALERYDLLLGDLRRLPVRDAAFDKAWSLDVLEHLSPQAFREVLLEARRVLKRDGRLFIYTHVRKNGWVAGGVRIVNRLAGLFERIGWLDLRQERLRKSDHLNPVADHDELERVLAECGFRIERITYYTPIVGAFVENILARVAERFLARQRAHGAGAPVSDEEAVRQARSSAQARVRRGGLTYRVLLGVSYLMRLDLVLFGRIRSGPFFALLRKADGDPPGA